MNPRPTSAPGPIRAPGRIRTVDGIPLHVLTEGTGPLCVLSGGLGMAWFDWDAVAALLAPYRTVIRFDRPGLGLSAAAPEPPTLAAEADRIARVLDALGHRGPATVVGHSLAGFHAEAFARLHPRRCAGLVLVDGSTEDDPRPLLPRALRTACASGVAAALSAAGVPRALGPAARRLIGRAQTVAAHPSHPWEHAGYRTSRVLRACVLENATYPYQAAELAALRPGHPLPAVPVAVLAAYDGGETARDLRWLERQRALAAVLGGRFTVAAPAGHLVMADAPEAVARAVLDLHDRNDRTSVNPSPTDR
ncbi:alpha/beta fold hydrolase [Streptomyces gilvosporeus]|uniref:Alpha/beta hydrolase n=1 Tax=Streptomyces gilvosporeus TaxID=553510 RepID=A0A1V0TPZ5_9ACTN|nr:alpha/beta hydrolase [Streptomyces gilvosporeus]ARF55019.1 alpha/beta hydrolase [Streptomyces gilvosporeus]